MRITKNNNSSIYYVIKDHIGSVNTLVAANGNVAQETYFDACLSAGALAKAEGFPRDSRTFEPLQYSVEGLISYGYTDHDHWDSFGLIYMKGRVYDPALGRFLNPDNYVQNSSDLQSYNRYTYCNNNPLRYTDPSGEFIFGSLLFGGLGFGVGMILDYTITKYLVTTQITGQERSWSGLGVAFATDAITVASGGVASFGFQPIGFIAGASFGAYTGFVSGFAGGFVSGTGNALLGGSNFGDALWSGSKSGAIGAGIGGVLGAYSAFRDGRNVLHGATYTNTARDKLRYLVNKAINDGITTPEEGAVKKYKVGRPADGAPGECRPGKPIDYPESETYGEKTFSKTGYKNNKIVLSRNQVNDMYYGRRPLEDINHEVLHANDMKNAAWWDNPSDRLEIFDGNVNYTPNQRITQWMEIKAYQINYNNTGDPMYLKYLQKYQSMWYA